MKKKHYVLDKPVKRIWSLNQLKVGETFSGVPAASYFENKKNNMFLKLGLDAGYSTLNIFFLIFSFPEQKILNSNISNPFELVKLYRNVNGEGIDEDITLLHDINWQTIIDWLNSLQILKIKVISKDMNNFKNIRFVSFID